MEILPAVARFEAADRPPSPAVGAVAIRGGERQPERPLLGPQHRAAAVPAERGAIVVRLAAEPRREQRIGAQRQVAVETEVDQQHVAPRRRADAQGEDEARVAMLDLDRRHAWGRQAEAIVAEPPQLDPEAAVVGDDEAEVLDLRDIDARIIDLGDDAFGDGEPQPRRAQRRADHVLMRARPSGMGGGVRRRDGAGRRLVSGHRRYNPTLFCMMPPSANTVVAVR